MNNDSKQSSSRLRRILKCALWVFMALVLTVCATLICTVKILHPGRLTPLLVNVANGALEADVSLARAELSFRPAFPLLEIRLDSLSVISHGFDSLAAAERAALPDFADTLMSMEKLSAGIDLSRLLRRGEIALTDVELVRPELNIVLGPDGSSNFDIYSSAPDTTSSTGPTIIPPFSIRRFTMVEPKAIRYFNSVDSTEATVLLIAHASLDGSEAPSYSLAVDGRLDSPVARQLLQLEGLRFGLDGRVRWNPATPMLVAAERFHVSGAFLGATLDASLNFAESMRVDSARLVTDPIAVDSLVTFLPDSIRLAYGLVPASFASDSRIILDARLTAPFTPETDSIPCAEATLSMAPSRLRFGRANFHNLSIDVTATTDGRNLDSTVVRLNRFTIAGPATALEASGTFRNLLSDPEFECIADGDIRFENLPPKVWELINGTLTGKLRVDISARGRLSMLELGRFHGLDVRGEATGTGLYYLAADTSKLVTVHKAHFRFGSQFTSRDTGAQAPTLAAALRIDSANALVSGVDMKLENLALGLGIENGGRPADSSAVVPMGGGIRIGSFKVISVTDSAGMRLRGLSGHVSLRRHQGDRHIPEITLRAGIERLVAGAPQARVLLRDANISALTYVRPERIRRRKELQHLTDSIATVYPHISPDSAYVMAVEARRRHRGPRRRISTRVENDAEVIDWELSKGFRRYLNEWVLDGTLKTDRTSLYTPYFPIRNRLSHLQVDFNNDSIVIDGLRYKAGHSDLAVDGIVSDIRRSLAGRRNNPLKVNFSISSDTLDINQLAATAFAGAAFADRLRRGESVATARLDSEDEDLDRQFSDAVAASDTLAPILIPTNIDASIRVRANNILYSDLLLDDFSGEVLVYDGAVNLNGLHASSDAGDVSLSALYSAPRSTDIRCGMGLELKGFNIERFLGLVPAIDSIMPLMRDFSGIIDADIAATVDIDSTMNMELPTLDAAVHLTGENLAFIDPETYRTIGKWLRFRDRADNHISHMSVQLLVRNNEMQLFPFEFDIDRYRLGVVGHNDLAMNFDYHIAVLKSPLPFKFGVTVKGNPEHYKVRLGGAKFKPGMAAERVDMVDTVRVNLVRQIQNVFRRGVSRSRFARLDTQTLESAGKIELGTDTLSHSDSLMLINSTDIPPAIEP